MSGFWLARWLMAHGIEVHIVQPSSVPVDRRMRRGKSDGIDAELLLRTLLAWLRGEPRVCSMVPIPDEADEDARRCIRERSELVVERVGLVNRICAVLATQGADDYNPLLRSRRRRLTELRTGLGDPIPPNALAKIARLLTRLELVLAQIAELERFPAGLNLFLAMGGFLTAANQIRSSLSVAARTNIAKGYSTDLGTRAVALVEAGESRREVARLLDLAASTTIRWMDLWQTTGSVAAKPGTAIATRRPSNMSSGCSIW